MTGRAEVEIAGNRHGHSRLNDAIRAEGRGAEEPLWLPVPEDWIERIAERAVKRVLVQLDIGSPKPPSPYLTVDEAATYLRCKRQRVYDLLSARRLTRYKDGSRVLVARSELDDYLAASGSSRVAPTLPRHARSRIGRRLPA